MRDLRAQLDGWAKRTRDREGSAEVATAAETLRDAVLEIEKTLLLPELRTEWEAYNYGVRLLGKLIALSADVALGDYRPTDVAEEVFAACKPRSTSRSPRSSSSRPTTCPPSTPAAARRNWGPSCSFRERYLPSARGRG